MHPPAHFCANSNAVGDLTSPPIEEREGGTLAAGPGSSNSVQIRVARDFAEVEALRGAWSKWPGHRDSEIDFYLMIVRSYPEVLRPHVIALYRDGQPGSDSHRKAGREEARV
jgi:hypothetical protein